MKKLISILLAAIIAVSGFAMTASAASNESYIREICSYDDIYDLLGLARSGATQLELSNKIVLENQVFNRMVGSASGVCFAQYKFKLTRSDTLKFTMEVAKNFVSSGVSAFIFNDDGDYFLDIGEDNFFSRDSRNRGRTYSKSIKLSKGSYYLIFATNRSTVGDFSLTVSAAKHIEKKPVVTVTALSKGKAKLSWKKVPGATKYAIYKYSSKKFKVVKKSTTKTSYTLTGLASGNVYYYGVKAYVNGKWTTLLPEEVVKVQVK
ncbi:MAG: hypothetical protein ACI4J4_09810 [Ruminiclostridium sp.]